MDTPSSAPVSGADAVTLAVAHEAPDPPGAAGLDPGADAGAAQDAQASAEATATAAPLTTRRIGTPED